MGKITEFIDRLRAPYAPRRRLTLDTAQLAPALESSRLIASLLFIATVAAIVLVSFVGVTNRTLPVLPNQIAPVRIVAAIPFNYESEQKTRALREQMNDRVPPVYRLNPDPLRLFELHFTELLGTLERLPSLAPADRDAFLVAQIEAFNSRSPGEPYRMTPDDLAVLLTTGDAAARAATVETAFTTLRLIHAQGIADSSYLGGERPSSGRLRLFQVLRPDGSLATRPIDSFDDALTFLRVNLAADEPDRDRALALFRLFRNGVIPNLSFDRATTEASQREALRNLRPVTISVERGQTIIEPDTRVTPEQFEMLEAHRRALASDSANARDESLRLGGRILLVLAMVVASLLYIRLEDPETLHSNSRLALLALVVLANLALVRGTYALGSLPYFLGNTGAASLLPYVAPAAIAPLIVALLINAGSAIFMALLIAIFTSVIWGGRLDLLVLTFLASMVAIYGVRATRKRGRIVRAALFGGLTMATCILLLGLADRLPSLTVLKQMLAGILTAIASGILVVGLLPVLEHLFKRTTDITLLELTDFNHPLLRLMQLEAPGTYHHSLVVAQLAENAAAAIGANPLLARVCALFHDIGKTTKPDYFIENQRDGINPHDFNNPSLSALVLKAHVKDGIDLALKHKLPRPVLDVIQQHHGTTLIRYFYHRAVSATRSPAAKSPPTLAVLATPSSSSDPSFMSLPAINSPTSPLPDQTPSLPGLEPAPVSQQTYRYDGPRPRFKESAIIHLADAVEAAARALPKVSPQHLAELIEQISRDRLNDHQLDEAPLTLAELAGIKKSFGHTLLNMLHGRISYPTSDTPSKA
ncbi:phosphohydrolase [Verrucomicrobia bacterium IMCC26134]|nr:phosphohydrolase [Verrucomicrobia bacterium IMCC26134]